MKWTTFLLLLMMLVPSFAVAGEIYGNIKKGKKPLGRGVPVEIKIKDKIYSSKTDKYGSYSLYVKETGKCILTVKGTKSSPSIQINSYKSSVRYDMVLYYKDGKWHLKRK